jgi:uroporphyrinogen decarboxylase
MNDRERFRAAMHYLPRDRSPICDFGYWPETLVVWHDQGLPEDISEEGGRYFHDFFGTDFPIRRAPSLTGIREGLVPHFREKVLEDRGHHEVVQQEDGVRVLRRKFMSSIPKPLSHLLVDRESWRKHYRPRLDPGHPDRYPKDWEERIQIWMDPRREYPLVLPGGSLYGWLRNWMGLEQLSYLVYDDPVLFEEMVTDVADCIFGTLERVLETGGQFDACAMWEDMCYNGGPLLNPRHFKQYLVPHYRRITDLLHRHGVDVIWVDCDGQIDLLIPLWLDAGVNCMFPVEVGTWGADPVRYRQEYGQNLLMMGGFDKRILTGPKEGIEAEVHRLTALVEQGGFVGFCDHLVPPDVPLDNYMFYLETVRRVWGQDTNLKPMGRLEGR